jgi:hypothetical protein
MLHFVNMTSITLGFGNYHFPLAAYIVMGVWEEDLPKPINGYGVACRVKLVMFWDGAPEIGHGSALDMCHRGSIKWVR